MALKKTAKATKKIKSSKGFGKGIAKQKKISRIRRSKEEREERSVKAEARVKKSVPVLERTVRDPTVKSSKSSRGKSPGFQEGMKVDDFLEHGFEQAMAEVSSDDDGDGDGEPAPAPAARSAKPNKKEGHKQQLEKLKESDPAFYEYLQKTDQTLLQFEDDEEGEEEGEEEEEEEEEEDEGDEEEDEQAAGEEEWEDEALVGDGDEEDEMEEVEDDDEGEEEQQPQKKGKRKAVRPQTEVTAEHVRGWERKLLHGENGAALKQLVAAFRCAVHYGDEEGEDEDDYPYTFTSGHVFNLLVQLCLSHMDQILRRHAAGGAAAAAKPFKSKSGTERPDQWPVWRKHQQHVKTYLSQLTHFLAKLSEAAMMLAVLQQVHRLLPFYLALPKLAPRLFKELLRAWSVGGSKETCLLAFASIRQLAAEMPAPFIDTCLKGTYLAFAQACRATNRKTLQRIALMSSCYVDLCAVDPAAAYQHAFVYIRQLAIHLRNAIQKPTADAYRQVYNWQYVNCLRLWAQVLCAHARSHTAPLRQLLYPLVQVTMGVARLLPNIRFAPLRLQCLRVLNQCAAELRVYIPVAPLVTEVFKFTELSHKPSGATTEKLLDWAVLLKVSKVDAGKRNYQEGMMVQAMFALAEHLHAIAYSVGFPEMAISLILALRAAAKKTKIVAFQKRCRALLTQIEAQAQWVATKRAAVDFSPKDKKQVAEFLSEEREAGEGPYSRWFKTQQAEMEAAEAAMRDVGEAKGKKIEAEDDDDDDLEEDEEIDDEEMEEASAKKKKKGKKADQAAAPLAGKAKKKKGAALDERMNDGDDLVEELQLSDSDDD